MKMAINDIEEEDVRNRENEGKRYTIEVEKEINSQNTPSCPLTIVYMASDLFGSTIHLIIA